MQYYKFPGSGHKNVYDFFSRSLSILVSHVFVKMFSGYNISLRPRFYLHCNQLNPTFNLHLLIYVILKTPLTQTLKHSMINFAINFESFLYNLDYLKASVNFSVIYLFSCHRTETQHMLLRKNIVGIVVHSIINFI